MSDKLQATTVATTSSSQETAVSSSSKINSSSGGKITNNKCFKLLFSSCFRTAASKTESLEDIVNNNVKRKYDYVVEKLVVKRVPFVLFSIKSQNRSLEEKISLWSKNNFNSNRVPQSQTKLSNVQNSDRFDMVHLHVSNKRLHFDKCNIWNKRNKKATLSNNCRNKIIEEREKAPKDPVLDMQKNKSLSEISLKGLNKNNTYQAEEAFKLQSFVQQAFSKKEGSQCSIIHLSILSSIFPEVTNFVSFQNLK